MQCLKSLLFLSSKNLIRKMIIILKSLKKKTLTMRQVWNLKKQMKKRKMKEIVSKLDRSVSKLSI